MYGSVAVAGGVAGGGAALAFTGFDGLLWVGVALLLLAVGTALLVVSRRYHQGVLARADVIAPAPTQNRRAPRR